MRSDAAPNRSKRGSRRVGRLRAAFTLIELLVVIAIIAILAAIIFPVFSAIRENARESDTMSHLHDISAALALYKLDNHKYPPVLFAYACDAYASNGGTLSANALAGESASVKDNCSTSDTMASIAGDPKATNELVGLYPEYVKDWHAFTCLNDTVNDPTGALIAGASGTQPQPNFLQATGALEAADGSTVAPNKAFFTADAFDINPQVETTNTLLAGATNNLNYVVRYQTSWTSWDTNYDPDNLTTSSTTPVLGATTLPFADSSYSRQLCWQNPPADTFVTTVTDHVPNANKIIVLYSDGSAHTKQMQLGAWTNGGWDEVGGAQPGTVASRTSPGYITPVTDPGTDKTNTTASGVACTYVPAGFWQYDITKR